MVRSFVLAFVFLAVMVVGPFRGVSADDEDAAKASPYGDTYTAEELAALDRALHAANCTREDLHCDRDMAKGHACLPVVRQMLADPLAIAPAMGWIADATGAADGPVVLRDVVARESLLWGEGWGALAFSLPPAVPAQRPATPDALATRLGALLAPVDVGLVPEGGAKPDAPLEPILGTDVGRELRLALPPQMAWHDVFASPYDEKETERLTDAIEKRDDAWVHETAARLDLDRLVSQWCERFPEPGAWKELPKTAFPTDEPLVVETSQGRIAVGTPGDDVYTGEYAILIDPGGNDRYVGCRIGAADGGRGRPFGLFVDLGGDDVYECSDVDLTLGAAVLGIAAFYDLGAGNDRYEAGHATLGAAMGGVAVFYDDGGSDVYEGKTYTQGAAGFGLGLFYDDAVQERPKMTTDEGTPDPVDITLFDNDRLTAWANAQAFARCRGLALCVNRRGNDVYEAGGVYLDAPLFSDRYQSFSQGFAIGQRDIDYAGGIAMMVDSDGNDRYLGDIYDQGVGYWYSAGLLFDGGGNDTYEMTQYGQGSGIHLAVGGLVDAAGHDTYVMHSGLGQGGSHDYACSILHDRGGNDRYLGNTSCNGSALTNSVAIQIDRAGDDVYAGRRKGGVNFGRPARGFSSIGILLDLAGTDDYLGIMADDETWIHSDVGVGVDVPAPEGTEPKPPSGAPDHPSENVPIPKVVSYQGDLTDEVFQELWDISRRWEVGDNRVIVPKARERLVGFGPAILEKLDRKVETDVGGLDLRAYVALLQGLRQKGDEEAVRAFLQQNAKSDVERRRRVALYLIGELGAEDLAPLVLSALDGEDPDLALRAAGVLAKLSSRKGDEVLRGWLDPATAASPQDAERRIRAALPVVLEAETPEAYRDARPLLDHPRISVRSTLATLLAQHMDAYGREVGEDLIGGAPVRVVSDRARRTLLDALARAKTPPLPMVFLGVVSKLDHEDWGVRADAARVLRHWADLEGIDAVTKETAVDALTLLLQDEKDSFVRFAAGEDR